MKRRVMLDNRGGGTVDGSKANTLDIVLYNFNSKKLEIVDGNKWSASSYPKFNNTSKPESSTSGFYPVGVVVIPGEHGVLKDGSGKKNQCGVMSLVPMNCDTPEKGGTSNWTINWGGYQLDISGKSDGLDRFDSVTNGLTDYTVVNYVGSWGTVYSDIKGTKDDLYLPSDAFSTLSNPYDTKTWYDNDVIDYYAPSPYQNDGSFNPAYSQTASPASERNALSDFKGIVNTKILTDLATGQSNWRIASTIENESGFTYYPAACCCARFKTPGTKAFVNCSTDELKNGTGFWYLPSCGELGYIVVRLKVIDSTISKLKSAYGVGLQVGDSGCWSSSEYDGLRARYVFTNGGRVWFPGKGGGSGFYVRAFMRL